MSTLASVIILDVYANIPAATTTGTLFFASDTGVAYRANGSTWDEIIPPPLVNAGAYDPTVTYSLNKYVSYAGSSWVSIQNTNFNNQPDISPTWWSLFVQKGASGGSLALTTKGDILGYDTASNRVPVGTNGQVLIADSTQALGLKWGTPTLPESAITSLTSDLAAKEATANKGAASGYCALDGSSLVPPANLPVFVASGASHAKGAVPDPGSTAGTTRYLREDSTWVTPPSGFSSPLTTKGDLHTYSTTDARLGVGTDGQFLAADSTQTTGLKWQTSRVPITWMMGTGATGTNVGKRLRASHAGQITTFGIVIDASDATTDLTLDIKKNGTSIFTSARTITHGASAGSITDFTSALTSNPTTVSKDDIFTLDLTSGTSSWQFTVSGS